MKTSVNLPSRATEERFIVVLKQVLKEYANEINRLEERIKQLEAKNA